MVGRTHANGAKVLIVEDEFLVALQLEDIVTEAGHDVVGIVPDCAAVEAIDSGFTSDAPIAVVG